MRGHKVKSSETKSDSKGGRDRSVLFANHIIGQGKSGCPASPQGKEGMSHARGAGPLHLLSSDRKYLASVLRVPQALLHSVPAGGNAAELQSTKIKQKTTMKATDAVLLLTKGRLQHFCPFNN
ncbi:hypothetical protein AV530_010759 [Patagioenas fasciata monilis]|uniref:Uncharacterized protein n=1 Tax=Patagioenas fasciata monilis TaxID=372326 RepID=A0A1V4K7N0_PATFA|nr:hypothetical protein AV530_010759 [Patagioenas fasciata monilis]